MKMRDLSTVYLCIYEQFLIINILNGRALGMIAHICHVSTWEAGGDVSGIQGLPGLHSETLFQK